MTEGNNRQRFNKTIIVAVGPRPCVSCEAFLVRAWIRIRATLPRLLQACVDATVKYSAHSIELRQLTQQVSQAVGPQRQSKALARLGQQ
jgi:hypothetical protein